MRQVIFNQNSPISLIFVMISEGNNAVITGVICRYHDEKRGIWAGSAFNSGIQRLSCALEKFPLAQLV
ncbi:hypothetical protein PTT72_13980 [Serratia ureilytica]|uniref:hypothetical protein n=1 Tax=Serratia ureilytica TaxID=300181 RepID=UPI00313B5397